MPTEAADLVVRPATPDDLPALAVVYVAARDAAAPQMPLPTHGPEALTTWVTSWDLSRRETWLAELGGSCVGFLVLTGDWLESLYVAPQHARKGVGSALVGLAQALRPGGFSLWAFESNAPARAFYAAHGLLELETTDGSANEENAPDLRLVWPGGDPVAFLRAQIDETDDELGRLLARRVALTHAVQQHKDVPGHAGRDLDRERQIAERMARHAPALGADRLDRIVHVIVTESLDASDGEV